ncbi:IclR family transcriptional regulator [Roseomonas marmotae]|uniref:Helix-turn-helix domain-containing protein n=1 Tax=Roseomonas marmotae TaxID=2768161 RepID=A0ABS3KBQ8_9PROT|nr:helix-turn-helix domain-containing protein [Roseomonas marmotae]MBO1074909.1 helix-turn-helix domain-containing protein [Roseomonas marmotae]QTI80043.1 helix-turn-helix domain-containing protein [Roseomonas marmotae]
MEFYSAGQNGMDAEESGGVAAVDRALSLLGAFRSGDHALELAELSARTGLYKSTILRLAQSLLRHRLLTRREDGRYAIGPAALRLGALYQASHDTAEVLLPLMRALSAATGESAVFYVRAGEARLCMHRVEAPRALRYTVREGETLPLNAGAPGHVLLAFGGAPGEAYDRIRARFWHAAFGERDPEIASIAAPVFTTGGRLAGALAVAGPLTRLDGGAMARIRRPLLEAAAEATLGFGGESGPLLRAAEYPEEIPE